MARAVSMVTLDPANLTMKIVCECVWVGVVHMSVCVSVHVCVPVYVCSCPWRQKGVSDLPAVTCGWELPGVVLGTELWSSTRAVHACKW